MKKLCYECGVTGECETYCQDAIEFEKQDNSDNYQKGRYTTKGIYLTGINKKRELIKRNLRDEHRNS